MTMTANVTSNHDTITVQVPLTFKRRGGRKQVVLPNGTSSWALPPAHIDNTIVKAIARAFRCNMLEGGQYATIREIATAENINESYVSRVLRLTLLAPEIVEAMLNGRQGPGITLAVLMMPFPVGGAKIAAWRGVM